MTVVSLRACLRAISGFKQIGDDVRFCAVCAARLVGGGASGGREPVGKWLSNCRHAAPRRAATRNTAVSAPMRVSVQKKRPI